MIEGSSTGFSTIYTVMKQAQKISVTLRQHDPVITFDSKATQIQIKFPEEFSGTVIRQGEFHIALNFLPLPGKKFHSSGLGDLLIGSGVYAAGTTSELTKGNSYNRGIRAQKVVMEVRFRLIWDAFNLLYGTQVTLEKTKSLLLTKTPSSVNRKSADMR